ncbi:hypothetical protein ABW48_24760 [Pluralibacter gergoviae]|nr:hypothetical protein ABW48_24760 [Pluralibacter gergoviae]
MSHHTKNCQFIGVWVNWGISIVHRQQGQSGSGLELFNSEAAVYFGDHDIAMLRTQRTVHHQQISITHTDILHAVSLSPHEICCGWMPDAIIVQV